MWVAMRSRNQRSWLMIDGAAGEVFQRLFQRAQGVDVEVVGRFVEQQQVGAGLQHLGQMHAVALAARQHADLLLLVGALEVEGAAIGARIDLALAEIEDVVAAGDFLPDVLLVVERVARLVDVAELTDSPILIACRNPACPGR
jgi:hypothetical protein